MDLPLTLALITALVLAVVAGVLGAALAWCGVRLFLQGQALGGLTDRLRKVERKAERINRTLAGFLEQVGMATDQNGAVHRKGAT